MLLDDRHGTGKENPPTLPQVGQIEGQRGPMQQLINKERTVDKITTKAENECQEGHGS